MSICQTARGRRLVAALVAAGALALAGCGGDGEEEETTSSTSTTETIEVPQTPTDPEAKLPDGWETATNRSAGFTIGVPPGWSSRRAADGQGTLLTSPDELVTISVLADRTEGALSLPLGEFSARTAEALGGEVAGDSQFSDLVVGNPAPFDHTYDAEAVRAVGTPSDTGTEESVLVVAIRRQDSAAFVAVVRQNAEQDSPAADKDTIKQVIRSLRARPPA